MTGLNVVINLHKMALLRTLFVDKAFQYTIVTITIGLTIGCSHNWDNQLSGQSGKCAIGQALVST